MYLPVNLLGPGPRLIKKEFTGPRSHKGWETLLYIITHLDERKRKSGNKKESKLKEKRKIYKEIKEKEGLYS